MPLPSDTLYPGETLYPGDPVVDEVFRAASGYKDPLKGEVGYQK